MRATLRGSSAADANDEVVVDPDIRVQQAIRSLFAKFEHQTSIRQLAMAYRDTQTLFPVRKPRTRDGLIWELPKPAVLHKLVNHPIYAGVYTFGRTQTIVDYADGKLVKRTKRLAAPDEWKVRMRDHHEVCRRATRRRSAGIHDPLGRQHLHESDSSKTSRPHDKLAGKTPAEIYRRRALCSVRRALEVPRAGHCGRA
jgi:hypothetical protein